MSTRAPDSRAACAAENPAFPLPTTITSYASSSRPITKSPLEPQDRADPLGRVEVVATAHGNGGPAVLERPAHGEVETLGARLHPPPVQRALPVAESGAPAGRTLPGLVVDAVLEEEHADASVGGGLEGVRPAGRRSTVAPGLFEPSLDGLRLSIGMRTVEQRCYQVEQLGGSGVSIGRRPADDGGPGLVREEAGELRSGLLGTGDDDPPFASYPMKLPLQLLGDGA